MTNIVTPEDNLFLVERTSILGWDVSPCDEAFSVEVINVDRRILRGDYTNYIWYKQWYDKGTNHREWERGICRDLGTKLKWAVRIDNIMEFVKKYGQCVIEIDLNGFNTIEIYDGYRE